MTQLRRTFLAAVLLSYGCKREPAATVFIDPALATLIPPDTIFLAGVRMKQLKDTAVYKRYGAKLPGLEDIRKQTGLNVTEDLWELVLAHDGKTGILLARGKFTEGGLEPKLERQGAKRFGYKGYTLIGDEQNAVMFMNATTAVAGPTPAIRSIIDGRDSGRGGIPAAIDAELKLIPSANQIWLAGAPFTTLPSAASRNLQNFTRDVKNVWGGADLRNGVDASLQLECAAAEDAKRVNDTARGLLGIARLTSQARSPELLKIYDGITVTQQNERVELKLALPLDAVDTLMNLLK